MVKDKLNNPPVYILENGFAVPCLRDSKKEEYTHEYLKEMLIAINRDKCNVKMYTHWSLLDGFEWESGNR